MFGCALPDQGVYQGDAKVRALMVLKFSASLLTGPWKLWLFLGCALLGRLARGAAGGGSAHARSPLWPEPAHSETRTPLKASPPPQRRHTGASGPDPSRY